MEKQSLLNGDKSAIYADSLTKTSYEKDDALALRPWQRWQRKQIVPAVVLVTDGFLGVSCIFEDSNSEILDISFIVSSHCLHFESLHNDGSKC